MDLSDRPEEAAFRAEARAWLDANAKRKVNRRDSWRPQTDDPMAEHKAWQAKLHDGGWACLHWPEEYGGRGATPIERVIWSQELANYQIPGGVFAIGQGMCGPVLMEYAKAEQKERYLDPMAKGDEIWCQLFSEPGAGSDVAGLSTRCNYDEATNEWVVNGQKVWTSGAHYSDYGILVARHDPSADKYRGLTFFFLDMKSPGVTVKGIKQVSGGSEFNEVYFDDVRIPDAQRLGAVGEGWRVVITTLMNERLAVGDASGPDAEEALELAESTLVDGRPAIEDGRVREQVAHWYAQKSGLTYTKFRRISALSRGETPGPEMSITKVVSANKLQQVGFFGIDILGIAGLGNSEENAMFRGAFLGAPGFRIAGGTDEILRNIIAERVLGLPQDPRADKGLAWEDIPRG